jgi:hypothetical protein
MAEHRVGLSSDCALVETMRLLDRTTFLGVRVSRTPKKAVEIDL